MSLKLSAFKYFGLTALLILCHAVTAMEPSLITSDRLQAKDDLALEAEDAYAFKPFTENSLSQIEEAHQGSNFFLVLWSVECVPCYRELEILAKNVQSDDFPKLIIVSTDRISLLPQVKAIIAKYGLETIQNWYFKGDLEQLRHVVDPKWHGEIPRTYLYSEDGSRTSHSGIMTQELLDMLLEFHL